MNAMLLPESQMPKGQVTKATAEFRSDVDHTKPRLVCNGKPLSDDFLWEWVNADTAGRRFLHEAYFDVPCDAGATWTVEDAGTWMQTRLPLPPPVVVGLIDADTKTFVIGPSKSKKTWLVTQLALCVSQGIPFLAWQTVRQRVLLVNLEVAPAFFQRRLESLCNTMAITTDDLAGNLFVANVRGVSFSLSDGVTLSRLQELIRERQITVVVLDPLYKLAEGDENSAQGDNCGRTGKARY